MHRVSQQDYFVTSPVFIASVRWVPFMTIYILLLTSFTIWNECVTTSSYIRCWKDLQTNKRCNRASSLIAPTPGLLVPLFPRCTLGIEAFFRMPYEDQFQGLMHKHWKKMRWEGILFLIEVYFLSALSAKLLCSLHITAICGLVHGITSSEVIQMHVSLHVTNC